jgi:hypothetical protein
VLLLAARLLAVLLGHLILKYLIFCVRGWQS